MRTCLTGEATEAEGQEVTCLKSHTYKVVQLGPDLRLRPLSTASRCFCSETGVSYGERGWQEGRDG